MYIVFCSHMATVTNAGEILTLTTIQEEQRDERPNSISISTHKKYVPYSPKQKFSVKRVFQGTEGENDDVTGPAVVSVESLPSESDDSDYDDFFDEIVDGGVNDNSSVHESSLASPIANSDGASELSKTTPINFQKPSSLRGISPKKSEEGSELSETIAINFHEPIGNHSISPKKSEEGSERSETTAMNFHEPIGNHSISPKKSKEGRELSETKAINSHEPIGNESISLKNCEGGSELSETTPINVGESSISSLNEKKKDEGSVLSETTPTNFREPSIRSLSAKKNDEESVLSETTPINFNEPTSIRSFSPISPLSPKGSKKSDDLSVLSDTTPIVFHEPTSIRNLSNKKSDDLSVLSDTTPINFREPSVRSLSAKNDEGSVLSDTTPMRFYESSTQFNVDDGSDDVSDDTPFGFRESKRSLGVSKRSLGMSKRSLGMSAAEKKASQRFETELRNLGMTAAQKKASQRFTSELFDAGMDEDAGRDIVNVYLEATAFADKERLNLTEDIYSFVLACSYCSFQFWVAIYFILVKYLCFLVVLYNLLMKLDYEGELIETGALATKFVMIPVSVAMQEDLITVYYNVANKKYDALTHKRNVHATETKWILCNLLRAIDGLLSMAVNFCVMLFNVDVMGIFSNFAALHFLQFIDDVIYELAEKGFFGHSMEQATIACKVITFTRRTTTGNKFNNFIINLDTILLVSSALVCYVIYLTFIISFYIKKENREGYLGRNSDFDIP